MPGSQTLAIIKPDAVAGGKLGLILAHLEREGYRIRAARLVRLSRAQAEAFYEVHRGRPFYEELVAFMSSGPCLPLVLEHKGAVAAFRATIGATDPAGRRRGRFGSSTPNRRATTRCTAPTATRMRPARSASFSARRSGPASGRDVDPTPLGM